MDKTDDGLAPPRHDLDLGHDTYARFTTWGDHDPVGLIEFHRCTGVNCGTGDGKPGWCGGSVLFDLPGVKQAFPNKAVWQVSSMEPLTLTPSVACGHSTCTHHGYITAGRWQPV